MTKPLNCPFCGSKETDLDDEDNDDEDDPMLRVSCFDCGASSGYAKSEAIAIDRWNKLPGRK